LFYSFVKALSETAQDVNKSRDTSVAVPLSNVKPTNIVMPEVKENTDHTSRRELSSFSGQPNLRITTTRGPLSSTSIWTATPLAQGKPVDSYFALPKSPTSDETSLMKSSNDKAPNTSVEPSKVDSVSEENPSLTRKGMENELMQGLTVQSPVVSTQQFHETPESKAKLKSPDSNDGNEDSNSFRFQNDRRQKELPQLQGKRQEVDVNILSPKESSTQTALSHGSETSSAV